MEPMETLTPEIAALFAAKEQRRRRLAACPYPEKVLMLVQLQRMAVPLLRQRNPRARVWQISETVPPVLPPAAG
jgi:hypothetical protein